MNRRRFFAPLVVIALVTVLDGTHAQGSRGRAVRDGSASPPNVLFVSVDDLNDWVGVLGGHPQARTPNIDRLARRGVLFTNAHTTAPGCNAARSSILTGLSPMTTGVHNNRVEMRDYLPEALTLPQHFRRNGYVAFGSGKIFHDPDPASWDDYFPSLTVPVPLPHPAPSSRPANGIGTVGNLDWGGEGIDPAEMSDTRISDWAVERLSEPRDRPFFMAVGFFRPHLHWYVPQRFFDARPLDEVVLPETTSGDLDDLSDSGRQIALSDDDHADIVAADAWKEGVRAYLASVDYVDEQVGRLLDALDAGPHAENTIVVLWSDHGFHLGEKEHWRKATLWEESTRVPLIVALPGDSNPTGRWERPVSLLDLFPTLADLSGLSRPAVLEGRSLASIVRSGGRVETNMRRRGDRRGARRSAASFATSAAPSVPHAITIRDPRTMSIRTSRYRLIRYWTGDVELYDRVRDPAEWDNLAGDPTYADEIERLLSLLPFARPE